MSYVPDVGDIVWLECDPQAGREQAGPDAESEGRGGARAPALTGSRI